MDVTCYKHIALYLPWVNSRFDPINSFTTDNPKNNGRSKLVLWDCQKKDMKNLMADLRMYNMHKQPENHIVLFNVTTDLEFEKKFLSEGIHGFFMSMTHWTFFLKE